MAKGNHEPARDRDRFDAYLFGRFAELKRELDQQIAAGKPKDGELRNFSTRGGLTARGGWTVGIAALLLVAVSVPLIMQLNQHREEMRAASADSQPAPADTDSAGGRAETRPPKDKTDAPLNRRGGKARQPEKSEIKAAEEKGAEFTFQKRALPQQDTYDRAAAAEEAMPQPLPAAPAARENARAEVNAASRAEQRGAAALAIPEARTRSAPVNDAQFRLKQSELAAIEKAEMEQLWKEYEKNPEVFLKDKRKTERLKLLLARHETRSPARRVRSQ